MLRLPLSASQQLVGSSGAPWVLPQPLHASQLSARFGFLLLVVRIPRSAPTFSMQGRPNPESSSQREPLLGGRDHAEAEEEEEEEGSGGASGVSRQERAGQVMWAGRLPQCALQRSHSSRAPLPPSALFSAGCCPFAHAATPPQTLLFPRAFANTRLLPRSRNSAAAQCSR